MRHSFGALLVIVVQYFWWKMVLIGTHRFMYIDNDMQT